MSEADASNRIHHRFAAAAGPARTPYTAPLSPDASALTKLKTRLWKEAGARAVPPAIAVTRAKNATRSRVAITFDDGPDEMTPQYLDVCDAIGLRATFFVIGENAANRPELVLEYVRRGHEIAGHGYTHTVFTKLAPAVLVDELARTADLLPASPTPRPLVRPPRGAISAASLVRTALAGFTTVLWSLDSDDCRTRDPNVVRERVSPRKVSSGEIILMHELQPWTLDALPGIVGGLRDAGFELCTVGELLGY